MKTKLLPAIVAALALACSTPLLHADEAAQRTAAAEDLLKAMHADEMMNNILARQRESITKMMPSLLPKDSSPEVAQQVQQMMPKILDSVYKQMTWESLKPDFIQIYSEVFTEQEIKDLTAFYKTPLGQKLIEKMPEVSEKSMLIMQKRMPAMMADMQKTIQESVAQAKAAAKAKASASPAK